MWAASTPVRVDRPPAASSYLRFPCRSRQDDDEEDTLLCHHLFCLTESCSLLSALLRFGLLSFFRLTRWQLGSSFRPFFPDLCRYGCYALSQRCLGRRGVSTTQLSAFYRSDHGPSSQTGRHSQSSLLLCCNYAPHTMSGNVTTLTALNLRCCPLEFPPQLIVQKGLAAIRAFLQACAAERPCARDLASLAISPVKKMTLTQRPHPPLDLPEERVPDRETLHSQEPKGTRFKKKVDLFPPVEKLDLSDLRRSTGSPEDWPSEEEIRRFWKLRQEIVEREQAETLAHRLLPVPLPPNLRAVLRAQHKEHPSHRHVPRTTQKPRRKPPSFGGVLPGLASVNTVLTGAPMLDDSRASGLRELREEQALLEQRRRDRRVLQEWRERAQTMRKRAEELSQVRPPRSSLVASKIPFATDLVDNEKIPANPSGNPRQSEEQTLPASEERSTDQGALEERLKQHIRQMHERRKRFRGMAPLEEIRKTTQDLEIARKLQDEVMKLKLGPT